MSVSTRMNEAKAADKKAAVANGLIKNDRAYRADCLVEAWSRIPEVGAGLKEMSLTDARNTAINLDRQAAYMKRMTEAQTSEAFQGFAPENMLRLVRLAMPNIVRNKIFTEFAMETARDSIKYMKPVFSKTQNGKDLNNRATDPAANNNDPWGYDDPNVRDNNAYDANAGKLHKGLYESTEDRYVQELANGKVAGSNGAYTITFEDPNFYTTTTENGVETKHYTKLIEGYSVVYYGDESHPIAIQDKVSGKFAVVSEWGTVDTKTGVATPTTVSYQKPTDSTPGTITLNLGDIPNAADVAEELAAKGVTAEVRAYARYNSEDDFAGDYLGEVQLKMWDYEFRPRPTTIGVTWSQLAELTLDTSFNVSAEEELVTYAAQEIRVALDYKAIRLAYQSALKNSKDYIVRFNASVTGNTNPTDAGFNAFGYKQNAQTFACAITKMEDVQLNDMNRGGVSRLVGGPAAASYCYLLDSYTSTGSMPNIGAHQVGEILNGIPLFKVPSSIIPNNRLLTVYKNEQNEADVSIVFGTLVPFYSTGTIVRKNFYKEVGIASYGDWALLNQRYLGIIQIDGIKDGAAN